MVAGAVSVAAVVDGVVGVAGAAEPTGLELVVVSRTADARIEGRATATGFGLPASTTGDTHEQSHECEQGGKHFSRPGLASRWDHLVPGCLRHSKGIGRDIPSRRPHSYWNSTLQDIW